MALTLQRQTSLPKTENYDYPMRRWLVYEETSTQFWVELLIPKHHAVDSAALNDYPPILAFLAWLRRHQGIRTVM